MPFRAADLRRYGDRPRRRCLDAALRRATAAAPPLAEPLEERVLMAAAVKLGKSGYSGTLSSNPATRQQQLICDPVEPKDGSTSVEYDPKLVHLTGLQAGPGYDLQAFVEVVDPNTAGGRRLATFAEYLRGQLPEAGYVQVKYQLIDPVKLPPGQITPPRENTILDEEGVDGIDTHALLFQPLKEASSDPQIKYRVFAAGPNTHSGNSADYLTINDGTSNTIEFGELAPADITPVPEVGSISGRMLEDTTDDGKESLDDKPIEKATVFLDLDRDGRLDTTEPTAETDENGNFLFEDVRPDTYDVLPVPPAGFFKQQSYPKDVPITVNVVKGRRTRGVDFGFTRPASLSGTVFADRDGDGARDVGEPGLPGTTVFIDANNNGAFDTGERSDQTDASGAWLIGSLRKGTYTVRFNPPAGYSRTAPGGTAGFAYTRTLNPGDNPNNLAFGARGIADLTITKTDGLTTAIPGQTITYTITVANPLLAGAATATVIDARVLDTVPAVLANVTWTAAFTGAGSGGNTSGAGNTIDELVTLAPGGTAVYTVSGTLPSAATGTLSNTATVTAPSTVVEGSTANNTATDTDTLTPRADLRVTLSGAPDPVYPGGQITYNPVVTNLGPSDAQNVSVVDTLPAGTTFVSAVAPPGWATTSPTVGGTGTVTFTRATLAAQSAAGFLITVRLNAAVGTGTVILNSASATTTTGDPNAANNSASETTLVVPQPPRVTRVFVNGTTWAAPFRNYLAANGLGEAAFGFDVGAGAASQPALPWTNVNQVSIRFDLPANVGPADLAVRGANVPLYGFTNYAYDFATNTATWTLSAAIPLDRVTLDLNGDAGGVTEFTGQSRLDGESTGNALPSGNGSPGGDFRFLLNVLPGDANRNGGVTVTDVGAVKARQGAVATPDTPIPYSPFLDVNGSGGVTIVDTGAAKARLGSTLSTVPVPVAATFAAPAPVGSPFAIRTILIEPTSDAAADELTELLA